MMNALVAGFGAVADGGDKVFTINYAGNNTYAVSYVLKSGNKQKVPLASCNTFPTNLQWDGSYLYYKVNGNLIRLQPRCGQRCTNRARGRQLLCRRKTVELLHDQPLPMFLFQQCLRSQRAAGLYL
ncbi:MAG: hypothetical protein R2932_49845 [Caldilineaceae bacterium]